MSEVMHMYVRGIDFAGWLVSDGAKVILGPRYEGSMQVFSPYK
jgi:endonuclease YncB( thermonuclease family)